MPQHFAVAIIGGGPAGYVAAVTAAQAGLSVALIEQNLLGGTCLNCGCIPSKALLESSEFFAKMTTAATNDSGFKLSVPELDLPAVMARKEAVVAQLRDGIAKLLEQGSVTLFSGTGFFADNDDSTIVIAAADNGPEERITADNIIIAVGSRPLELPIAPFGDNVISSTTALALQEVPSSLAIIGGGAIGLELGSVWARLGSKVTILEMLPQIGGTGDRQLASTLERSLKKQGLDIRTGTKVLAVNQDDSGVRITIERRGQQEQLQAAKLLVAAGRVPNTAAILKSIPQLAHDQRGFITVDDNFVTSRPHILAIGDCIGGAMLAHKAEDEGRAVIAKICNKNTKVQKSVIPAVIYTNPELAQVGMTDQQATANGLSVKCGKSYFAANGRALSMDSTEGLVKVVVSTNDNTIIGIQILGPHASELLGEATLAVQNHLTIETLAATCHAHPTLSEALRAAALTMV